MIRQPVGKINITGRNTQGVKLLRLENNNKIASVTKVIKEDNLEEDGSNQEENTEK